MAEQNSHTISHAQFLYVGPAYGRGTARNSKRGIPLTPIVQVSLGAPLILSTTRILATTAVPSTAAITTMTNATTGATYGRTLQVVSSSAGDTTQTITITGTDGWGSPLIESVALNGTTPVTTMKKAFTTVTSVASSAALAGNLSVGTTDSLGLPYGLAGTYDILQKYIDSTVEAAATGTHTAAVTTSPATATTGDVRGTWLPGTVTNSSRVYRIWYRVSGLDQVGAYGVKQYGDTQVLANV